MKKFLIKILLACITTLSSQVVVAQENDAVFSNPDGIVQSIKVPATLTLWMYRDRAGERKQRLEISNLVDDGVFMSGRAWMYGKAQNGCMVWDMPLKGNIPGDEPLMLAIQVTDDLACRVTYQIFFSKDGTFLSGTYSDEESYGELKSE